MTKYTEARKKANLKWDENNKQRKQYLNRRSTAKNFILKLATDEDLQMLQEAINTRKKKEDDENSVHPITTNWRKA